MKMRKKSLEIWWFDWEMDWRRLGRWLLPTPGNALFTLLVVAGLLWANSAGALPLHTPAAAGTSTGTINYQGYLTDSSGNPVNDTLDMGFRLYNVESGGEALWTETQNVEVQDGLFSVLLGSVTDIPAGGVANNDDLWLGIAVGADDEMSPREKIASVPYAMSASCRPGFWSVGDGRLCMESALRGPNNMHEAIGICRGVGPGSRVCGHNDFQQACGAGYDPYSGQGLGWYGDHGGGDNIYMTWNRSYCSNDNDGPPYGQGDLSTYYRCCY